MKKEAPGVALRRVIDGHCIANMKRKNPKPFVIPPGTNDPTRSRAEPVKIMPQRRALGNVVML